MRQITLILTAIAGLGWVYNNPRSPILHCLFSSTAALNCSTGETVSFTRATTATWLQPDATVDTYASGAARYDDVDGLVVEGASTNLALYSEVFDNGVWYVDAGVTITPDAAIGPDSNQTADQYAGTDGTHFIGQGIAFTEGQQYTVSLFVKRAGGAASQSFRLFGCNSQVSSDLPITNSWARYSYTFTAPAGCDGTPRTGLARNSANEDLNIYVFGAQPEAGPIATSYIPTTASQATRNADRPTIPVAGNILAAQGSISLSVTHHRGYDVGGNRVAFLCGANAYLYYDSSVDAWIFVWDNEGGAAQSAAQSFSVQDTQEIDVSWTAGGKARLCVDGACTTTAGNITAPALNSDCNIGRNASNANYLFGSINGFTARRRP